MSVWATTAMVTCGIRRSSDLQQRQQGQCLTITINEMKWCNNAVSGLLSLFFANHFDWPLIVALQFVKENQTRTYLIMVNVCGFELFIWTMPQGDHEMMHPLLDIGQFKTPCQQSDKMLCKWPSRIYINQSWTYHLDTKINPEKKEAEKNEELVTFIV